MRSKQRLIPGLCRKHAKRYEARTHTTERMERNLEQEKSISPEKRLVAFAGGHHGGGQLFGPAAAGLPVRYPAAAAWQTS